MLTPVPPVRVVREGVVVEELLRLFWRNSRFPDILRGDIRAVLAGCRLGEWARVFVGYNFLGVSSIVRPGDHFDHNINVSRQAQVSTAAAAGLPVPQQPNGPFSPAFSFRDSSFWAQGLGFGVEFRF